MEKLVDTAEKDPDFKVEIKFGPENEFQKFVDFEDNKGNYFVFSVPFSELNFHPDIFKKAIDHFGLDENVFRKGGGFLEYEKNKIILYGTSENLKDFDHIKSKKAFEMFFKDKEVVVE